MAKAKNTAAKVIEAPVVSLHEIVAATKAGSFMYVNQADVAELLEAGKIELNHSMVNEAGEIAARATVLGTAEIDGDEGDDTQEQQTQFGGFSLDDGIAVPKQKRGGRNCTIYPFEQMNPGQSFFVAATADKPNPAKSLASTVTSATARFAQGTGQFKDVVVKQYQTDADGERMRDANDKLIVIGQTTERREVMKETRKFIIRAVEENGVKGARIWRSE